jgi:hypothetical protein
VINPEPSVLAPSGPWGAVAAMEREPAQMKMARESASVQERNVLPLATNLML